MKSFIMHLKGTVRCFFLIVCLYLVTLCFVYKCVPDLKFGSDAMLEANRGHAVRKNPPKDVYKLQWNPKEKMFYKKVRSVNKEQVKLNVSLNNSVIKYKSDVDKSYIKVTSDFHIFSAFYDNRLDISYIRIIATFKKYSEKKNTYWCHFHIPDIEKKYFDYVSSKVAYYEMCENHKRSIGGWMLSCEVPTELISPPVVFWISTSAVYQKDPSKTIEIRVSKTGSLSMSNNETSQTIGRKFAICVPPLFGIIDSKAFIEFIEFARILGVDKIFFYVFDVQGEIKKILNHYKLLDYVDTIPWQLPFHHKSVWNYGQSLAVNDCLYRHMSGFNYLAFLDIDEVLVPRKDAKTWADLIQSISESTQSDSESISGYTFRSTFFDPNFSRSAHYNEASHVVRINRTDRFSFFRNKVLVLPSRVFELGIHHVSRSWPDHKNYTMVKVNPSLAAIYHYRACIDEFGIHCKETKEDVTVGVKYGKKLTENVMARMMKIVR